MKLHSIEKIKEIKPGFLRASAIFGKNMVLLFRVNKDVVLDNHKHPHAQFGYCFEGEFEFNVNGAVNKVDKDVSYLISSDIPHSAVALTDYYSMDFKVITTENENNEVSYDVMSESKCTEGFTQKQCKIGNNLIYQINTEKDDAEVSLDLLSDKQYCLMVGSTTRIHLMSKEILTIEPMKIYLLHGEGTTGFQVEHKDTTIFIVEV